MQAHIPCPGCALPIASEGLCGHCLQRPFAFDRVFSACDYKYPLTHLIQAFKYQRRLSFARPLAHLMLAKPQPQADALIPMPLHFNRLRARGFNQAQALAIHLARHSGIPLLRNAAIRIRDTPKQSLLAETARQHNLQQAFHIMPEKVRGLSVIVIDDVMTSGASLHALALSLKKAGALSVYCWVLARTLAHTPV